MIEERGVLHPIEIKKGSAPPKSAIRSFSAIRGISGQIGCGGIVCMTDVPLPIDENNCYIQSNII